MNLKTVTFVAAIAVLLSILCQILNAVNTFGQVAYNHVVMGNILLVMVGMVLNLFAWIAIDVFLFTLAAKQK